MAKRNFFILFDTDGATSKGRTGWNVSRGPRLINKATGIDTGCMYGQLCYRDDKNDSAYVGVGTAADVQEDGKVKLTMTLNIPAGATVTTFADGKMTIEIVSTYTP